MYKYNFIMRSRIFWSVFGVGPCNVVKPGSLVAAKRAVENAKDPPEPRSRDGAIMQ